MANKKNLLALIAAFIVAVLSDSESENELVVIKEEFDLKQVHMVFRHGDRTRDNPTYPLNPHKDNIFEPYGLGQLTKAGYVRCFENGKFFRQRYDNFLGSTFNQSDVHTQSTGFPRTRMSLQLFMAGMFPPSGTFFDWNPKLNWQPFDLISLPVNNDSVLMPLGMNCPQFNAEFARGYGSVIQANKNFFTNLFKATGQPILTPFDIPTIYYALKTEETHGLAIPAWAENYYPKVLHKFSNEAWGYLVHTDNLVRIMAGKLLQKMIDDWERKAANASSKKMFLYSGHDATVISILGAFNVWNRTESPEYGITAIFEMKQSRKTGEHGVQIYMRNEPNNEPVLLTIPGCKAFCPLSKLKILVSNHLPTPTDCELTEVAARERLQDNRW